MFSEMFGESFKSGYVTTEPFMADAGERDFLDVCRWPKRPKKSIPQVVVEKVNQIDLTMVKLRLCLPPEKEGDGWTPEQAHMGEVWYKRFLILGELYPKAKVVPTKAIDTVWHRHILDTRAYYQDCMETFGHLVHHYPYFGLLGEDDAKQLEQSFHATMALFMEHFGESPNDPKAGCNWNNCGYGSCKK